MKFKKVKYKILLYKENTLKQTWKQAQLLWLSAKQRSETQSWHQQNSKKNMAPFITAKVSQATVGVTEFLHHIWADKEEKDKWITSKFSGFNCQIGLCHSMFYIRVCVKSWILKDFISTLNWRPLRTCKGTGDKFYK